MARRAKAATSGPRRARSNAVARSAVVPGAAHAVTAVPRRPTNPAAIPPGDLAGLLSAATGEAVTEAMVAEDLDAGAPTNPDGTVNIVHYGAWLAGLASGA